MQQSMSYANDVVKLMPLLHKWAMTMCSNAMDRDDIVMSTVLKLLESEERYVSEDFRLIPLAKNILHNCFIDFARHEKWTTDATCDSGDNHYDVEASRTLKDIYDISASNSNVRCAVMYAEGYGYDEIGHSENLSQDAARARVSRGRKYLIERFC